MWQVKQQVNFYTDEFKPAKIPQELVIWAAAMLLVLLASIVGKVLLFGLAQYQANEIAKQEQLQKNLTQKLEQQARQLERLQVDPALQAQIEREEKQISQRQQVLSFLHQQNFAEMVSFAQLAEHLAVSSAVWLTNFRFYQGGQHIELLGFSKKPKDVAAYIQMLGDKKIYQGRSFKQISINEVEDENYHQFFLSTEQQDERNLLLGERE